MKPYNIHVLYFPGDSISVPPAVKSFLKPRQVCQFLLQDMINAHGTCDLTDLAAEATKNDDISEVLKLHKQYFDFEYVKYYSIDLEERTC